MVNKRAEWEQPRRKNCQQNSWYTFVYTYIYIYMFLYIIIIVHIIIITSYIFAFYLHRVNANLIFLE